MGLFWGFHGIKLRTLQLGKDFQSLLKSIEFLVFLKRPEILILLETFTVL